MTRYKMNESLFLYRNNNGTYTLVGYLDSIGCLINKRFVTHSESLNWLKETFPNKVISFTKEKL